MENSNQQTNQPTNHLHQISSNQTRWVFSSEDLVQKRFGNSSAAKGLEALLGEARAAEAEDVGQISLALDMCP